MFAKHSLFNSSLYRSLGIPPSVLGKLKICLLNTHVSPPHFFPDHRRWSMTIIHVNTNPERTNYPLITVLLQPTRLTMLTWSIQQFDIKYRCQKTEFKLWNWLIQSTAKSKTNEAQKWYSRSTQRLNEIYPLSLKALQKITKYFSLLKNENNRHHSHQRSNKKATVVLFWCVFFYAIGLGSVG